MFFVGKDLWHQKEGLVLAQNLHSKLPTKKKIASIHKHAIKICRGTPFLDIQGATNWNHQWNMKHQETCPHKGSIHPTRQSRSYHFFKALKTFAGGSVWRNQPFLSGNLLDGTRDVKTSVFSEAGQHRNCPKKRFFYIFETFPWPLLRCDYDTKTIIFLEDDLLGFIWCFWCWIFLK